jgi:hypothetical protein
MLACRSAAAAAACRKPCIAWLSATQRASAPRSSQAAFQAPPLGVCVGMHASLSTMSRSPRAIVIQVMHSLLPAGQHPDHDRSLCQRRSVVSHAMALAFTPQHAALGGTILGAATVGSLLLNGRVLGISGAVKCVLCCGVRVVGSSPGSPYGQGCRGWQ